MAQEMRIVLRNYGKIDPLKIEDLGSGAVFVLDETRDIVDVVTRIAKFFEHESCGKCTPWREGTKRMHELMKKIRNGLATEADLALISSLGNNMKKICLCGLGQAAPIPVLTTIEHFKNDYITKLPA